MDDNGSVASAAENLMPSGTDDGLPKTITARDCDGAQVQKTFANAAVMNVWLASYEAQTMGEMTRIA